VPFEFYEHTADVGIRAWGDSLPEAFGQAALGLIANMVETPSADALEDVHLSVQAANAERLLFRFLEEVLFHFQTELVVFTAADVRLDLSAGKLDAQLRGERYDAARHGHVHEIKAITMHDLALSYEPPEVRLIVDI